MKKYWYLLTGILILISFNLIACQSGSTSSGKNTIVVTYSILGSIVKDLVGDQALVVVTMPNGQDPHEWYPSAKDIEMINKADLVVQNGLNLEGGMQKALAGAQQSGVKFFTASDYIEIRHVGQGEGIPNGDPDQAIGAADPHIWTDPLTIKEVVSALAGQLKKVLNLDVSTQAANLEGRLDDLNKQIIATVGVIPQSDRKLVTGHESMGYFAQRYNFKLVGVIVPSLTSQAEVSAADLSGLKKVIQENQVKAIFTELGTSSKVAEAIGQETGVKVVQLATHILPADGSYFTFMKNLAGTITENLK